MEEPTRSPYLAEVLAKFSEASDHKLDSLYQISDDLLVSFQSALQNSKVCMLPSFTDTLPNGKEYGSTVALDLGGSTLRVAVIQLRPHERIPGNDPEHLLKLMRIIARQSWLVSDIVKKLPADEFFDWIAARIGAVVQAAGLGNGSNRSLGITWSFPVEPLSSASGRVQQMGKGYEQWRTIAGTDLKGHIDAALYRAGLRLRMTSLMNDTEATLLSHAYANPATRLSLIWGTGLNASVYVPLPAVGKGKLEGRPVPWMHRARAVVVNTEVSMFGAGLLPLTDADQSLDSNSPLPGFQPLEQLTSGRYLGEICRLALLEAVKRKELFRGVMPKGLDREFALDTSICSAFEEPDPTRGPDALTKTFGFSATPTAADIFFVRSLCEVVSTRSASLIATVLFTLYRMQRDIHQKGRLSPALPDEGSTTPVVIAFCGAVAEKHATALVKCQKTLDLLVEKEGGDMTKRRLVLEAAGDSGLLGAAVGAVMNESGEMVPAKL